MKFCKKCIMPDTKPDLEFNDDGVCSACSNFTDRKDLNWED